MATSSKISLRGAWYGLIVLATILPAIALTPWLSMHAHDLLLNKAILTEKLLHHEIEVTLELETKRITSVLLNKADTYAREIQKSSARQLAQSVINRDTFISTITIYDKDARIIASSRHKGHTKAPATKDSPSFAVPMQGKTFIGAVSELEDGHLELVISVPIMQNGIAEGVIASTINTNLLWESIQKETSDDLSHTYLVDSHGALLINLPGSKYKQGDLLSAQTIVTRLLQGSPWNEQKAFTGINGEEVFGISSMIPVLKWGIISELPSSKVLEPIYSAIIILTIIVFLFHIVFGVISILISRQLLAPVSDLVSVMAKIKGGNYQKAREHKKFKEISELTSSFNNMIEEIQQRETSLLKLSQAIEQAGESVIITDGLGNIEYVNPSFTKITGYAKEDVMGQNPRILKSGNQPDEYYINMWATISSGKIWRSSIVDRRKDGTLYPAIATISPIFNNKGEITHYIGTQQDMTENKQLEEKFRQAQKMEAIGVLVGGIAHDFNNMLAAVASHLHLAKDLPSCSPEIAEKIDIVERLTFDASDMVKQLLMFSRKAHVEMKPFGLISFVKEISKVCKAGVPENIQFNVSFHSEELVVKGDATQLQQVIMNLINNARDALEDARNPKISLKIDIFKTNEAFKTKHPEVLHDQFAHIALTDNGHGITDADKAHIFDPFYTTKEVGLGTGLGLSMAYGVIQNHNGIIDVESVVNEGTSFHIYLPLLEVGRSIATSEAQTKPMTGNNELILLVDDNQDVRHTAKHVLEKLGYRIIEAIDGHQAIETFKEHQDEISLVITDVVMPKMGGVQAMEEIRKISPDIKAIFITGYDAGEIVASDLVNSTVVSKPYRVHHLSKVVSDLLQS